MAYDQELDKMLHEFDPVIGPYDRLIVRIHSYDDKEPKLWIGRQVNVNGRAKKLGRITSDELTAVIPVLIQALKWMKEYTRIHIHGKGA